MPYLIDGHNLIGQLPGLSLDDEHDEAKLVERLKGYMLRHRRRCTVVFDGGLPGGPSRTLSSSSVRVIFAHGGTNADRIIRERIGHIPDPRNWTIISADHEILSAARGRHMRIVRPADFARELDAPPIPTDPGGGAAADVRLSPGEVDDWLRIFGAGGAPDDAPDGDVRDE